MIIDLLRHGEVEGETCFRGHTNEPLSKTGWQQLQSALHNYKTDLVIYSPLIRCAEFAQQWSLEQNLESHVMDEFMEINFGDWDGLSTEQIQETQRNELNMFWNNPVKNTPPNGEHLVDFKKRVLAGWQNMIKQHKDKNILLVTHGGVIRMIIAHVLSMPLENLLSLELPLAAMSRIRISFDDDNNQYASLVFHAGEAK